MVEGDQTQRLPPAYNEVINSTVFTISVPDEEAATPSVVASSQPSPTTDPLPSTLLGNLQSEPPSYESLYENRRSKITSGSQQQTDCSAGSSTLPDSTSATESQSPPRPCCPQPSCPRPSCLRPNCPQSNCSPSSCCGSLCHDLKSQKAKNVYARIILVSTIIVCIVITAIGSMYSCLASPFLPSMMQASGIAGLIYLTFVGVRIRMNRHFSQNKWSHCGLIFLFPIILTIIFCLGCYNMSIVWRNKWCYPGVGAGCNEDYCSDYIMWTSIVFYSTSAILLLPVWFIIIYFVFSGILLCLGRMFCPDKQYRCGSDGYHFLRKCLH